MESKPNNAQMYWAAKPDTEFANELWNRLQQAMTDSQNNIVSTLQRNAYRLYFDGATNDMSGPTGTMITRGGSSGEFAQLRINQARSDLQALIQVITTPAVTWKANALNSDPESSSASTAANILLENQWKTRKVNRLAVEAVEQGFWAGECFLHMPWSKTIGPDVVFGAKSGDIDYELVPSWRCLRDSAKRSFKDCKWLGVMTYKNKFDLAAEFPDQADQIIALPGGATNLTSQNSVESLQVNTTGVISSDDVLVIHWYHDKTPALPLGRQSIICAANLLLDDGPMVYKTMPVHRFAAGELAGTCYPYSKWWLASGPQDLADSITTSLATGITTFGSPMISVEIGDETSVDSLSGGPTVIYRKPGSPAPLPIVFPTMPQGADKILNIIQEGGRTLLGLNSVSVGQPSAMGSGAAFSVLYSASTQQQAGHLADYMEFLRGIGQSIVETYQKFCPTPRMIAIIGESNKNLLQPNIKVSSDTLKPIDSISVQLDNSVGSTTAGRLELARLYADPAFANQPEKLTQLLETGRMEAFSQNPLNQKLLVDWENQELRAGRQVIVSFTDNHPAHGLEHAAELSKPEVRNNPAAVQAISEHLKAHGQTWQTTDPLTAQLAGVPPPPQFGPPPGAPGPGPGPQSTESAPPASSEVVQGPPSGQPPLNFPKNPVSGEKFNPQNGGTPPNKQ